jgi:hypothetical protein
MTAASTICSKICWPASPAHTPEWTNPRLGDPGRTLLELFAWLGDALLYRANLIPERQRLVFLKLLGQGLRPARPAAAIVSLAFAQPTELAAVTLAPGARIKAPLPFETLAETTLLPMAAEVWYKQPLADADAARMEAVIAGLQKVHRIDGVAKGYLASPLFEGGQAASGRGGRRLRAGRRSRLVAGFAGSCRAAPRPAGGYQYRRPHGARWWRQRCHRHALGRCGTGDRRSGAV